MSKLFIENKKYLFEYFLNFLSFNFRQYQVYKYYDKHGALFESCVPMYRVFSSSFARLHFLGLAILLDPKNTKSGNTNFSARWFDLENKLDKPEVKKVAGKIRNLRRKWLAHQDLSFVLENSKIDELDIKKEVDEIKLFDSLIDIAKNFAETEFQSTRYRIDERFTEIEKDVCIFFKKMYNSDESL